MIGEFVAALDAAGCRPKQRGSNWIFSCPAHDDKHPSASCREGDTQPVVAFCFGGCTYEQIATRIGYQNGTTPKPAPIQRSESWEDALFRHPEKLAFLTGPRRLTLDAIIGARIGFDGERYTIPIMDASGQIVCHKLYLPGGKPKFLTIPSGVGAQLYGLETLADLPDRAQVVVTEGELDAVYLRSLGLNAVSGTAGASTWRPEWTEALSRFRVVACGDNDGPGQKYNLMIGAPAVQWPAGTAAGADPTDYGPGILDLIRDAAERNRVVALNLAEELLKPPEPIPWAVRDWLAEGDTVALAGESAVGKSWVSLDLALALAAGSEWCGSMPVSRRYRVAVLDEENSTRLALWRIRKLSNGVRLPHEFAALDIAYYSNQGLNLDDSARFAALEDALSEFRPDWVVMDTLIRFHRRDENDNSGMAAFFNARIKPLSRSLRCGVVLLHHFAKPGISRSASDLGNRVRGAGEIRNYVDGLWTLTRDDMARSTLTSIKSRWQSEPKPVAVEIQDTPDGEGVRIVAETVESSVEQIILAMLPASPGQIGDALEAAGLKSGERLAKKYLARMLSVGKLIRTGAGGRAGYVYSLNGERMGNDMGNEN